MEGAILLWIQENLRNPVLTEILRAVTHTSDHGEIWILCGLLLLCFPKSRRAGLTVLLSLMLCFVLNNMLLKNIVARTRPYEVVEGLIPLVPRLRDFSFPSGHTAISFAAAVSIYRTMPRTYGVAALILAAVIAASRLYLGVHYPSDVLGGIMGGMIAAYAAGMFFHLHRCESPV